MYRLPAMFLRCVLLDFECSGSRPVQIYSIIHNFWRVFPAPPACSWDGCSQLDKSISILLRGVPGLYSPFASIGSYGVNTDFSLFSTKCQWIIIALLCKFCIHFIKEFLPFLLYFGELRYECDEGWSVFLCCFWGHVIESGKKSGWVCLKMMTGFSQRNVCWIR